MLNKNIASKMFVGKTSFLCFNCVLFLTFLTHDLPDEIKRGEIFGFQEQTKPLCYCNKDMLTVTILACPCEVSLNWLHVNVYFHPARPPRQDSS